MKWKRKTKDIMSEGTEYKDVTSDKHKPKRMTVQLI